MNRFIIKAFVVFIIFFSFPRAAVSLTESFNIINFKPAIDKSRYFSVYGSQTLKKHGMVTGFYVDYAKSPIKFDLTGKSQKLIDQLLVIDTYASFGLLDWWQIGINIPVVALDSYTDPSTTRQEYRHSLSDIRLETKFRFLDPDRYYIGISLLPFVEIPTGLGDTYVSNGSFSGGAKLVSEFFPLEVLSFSLNVGYSARKHFTDIYGADIDDQFLYGLGMALSPVRKISLLVEFSGLTDVNNFFFKDKFHSPMEVRGGIGIFLPKNFVLRAGAGHGLVGGYGDPYFRAIANLSYSYEPKPKIEKPSPTKLPEEYEKDMAMEQLKNLISSYKIYFRLGSFSINPLYHEKLDEIANILIEHPYLKMQINGYTCSIGKQEKNIILSNLRAMAVETYLINRGVLQTNLTHEGFGKENPAADNATLEGKKLNRRVEFVVTTSP